VKNVVECEHKKNCLDLIDCSFNVHPSGQKDLFSILQNMLVFIISWQSKLKSFGGELYNH
jgi:hypothetical protein